VFIRPGQHMMGEPPIDSSNSMNDQLNQFTIDQILTNWCRFWWDKIILHRVFIA